MAIQKGQLTSGFAFSKSKRFIFILLIVLIGLIGAWTQTALRATLTPSPAEAQTGLNGYFDQATCSDFRGWAGVLGEADRSINVHFYAGPAESGVFIGDTVANQPRESAVCQTLGGTNCNVCPSGDAQCLHGFSMLPPRSVLNGAPLDIYAYAFDPETGANRHLGTSPKLISCEGGQTLNFREGWISDISKNSTRSATGDIDNDGDLDLIVGSSRVSTETLQLYLNQGDGQFVPNWVAPQRDRVVSVALADMDGDGDLDLATGVINIDDPDQAQNRIYINNGMSTEGIVLYEPFWQSPHSDQTVDIAWGDVDNDGDPDLAVGNMGAGDIVGAPIRLPTGRVNRVYRNNHIGPADVPIFQSIWSSSVSKVTTSIAWGDINQDGYLDLVTGNADADFKSGCLNLLGNDCEVDIGERNHLYLNNGSGNLLVNPSWESAESEATSSVALADIDGDGDLDLAVGNGSITPLRDFNITDIEDTKPAGHTNRIYLNDDGKLQSASFWSSAESDATTEVVWGDYDNDGDPDLLVANVSRFMSGADGEEIISGSPKNRIYRNDGGTFNPLSTYSFSQSDDTLGILFADIDNDGDLDVASANGSLRRGELDRIIRNDDAFLSDRPTWSSESAQNTWDTAWADIDGDGDQDLVAGNGGEDEPAANQLYINEGGQLILSDWSPEPDHTTSVAFGDVDGDFDLDLIVGNYGESNRLYLNTGGELDLDTSWSVDADLTSAVAWADINGDGPLDLVIASKDGPSRVYLNNGNTLETEPVWESPEGDYASSLSVGDVDKDGDVDFVVGSKHIIKPVRLYRNNSNQIDGSIRFENVWESPSADIRDVRAIALGDVNQDGFLDLAVGNFGDPVYLYLNKNGIFEAEYSWSSHDGNQTDALQWGDYDGDGDLDLFEGNDQQSNTLYINENGVLGEDNRPSWSSVELGNSRSVSWGDPDLDGDLDILVGNRNNKLRLYHNPVRSQTDGGNGPPFVTVEKPGKTDSASFFSSPEILQGPQITISYTLFDAESETVTQIIPEYSIDGGQEWYPATPYSDTVTTNLETAPWPMGVTHRFVWDVFADLIKNDAVVFRVAVRPEVHPSPVLWGELGAVSPSFRVADPKFIQVLDEEGHPVAGTHLYADGEQITETQNGSVQTDSAGRLNPISLPLGTSLTVLAEMKRVMTQRRCHQSDPERSIHRTTVTNIDWSDSGSATFDKVDGQNIQRVVLNPESPLVLFDLLVSVEWDAGQAYLDDLALAMKRASDYLYDATDGQMAFGSVKIYSGKECWNGADIRISAANDIIPHAATGQLGNPDPVANIRLGRGWDRYGQAAPWSENDGFRTIIHEFAHYAFGVFDEYQAPKLNDAGDIIGIGKGFCIGPEIELDQKNDVTNASIMYWQYTTSEFSSRGGVGLWNEEWCNDTRQFLEHEQSVWETIDEQYSDDRFDDLRWQITTPAERGVLMDGPTSLLDVLPSLPIVEVVNSESKNPQVQYLVVRDKETKETVAGVNITLVSSTGSTLKQGSTDSAGAIEIVGAREGDIVKALTIDGGLQGRYNITDFESDTLYLEPVGG